MRSSLRQQGIWFAPFSVSPSGGKPGAPPPPLSYGSGNAPAQNQSRLLRLRAGKEVGMFFGTGLRPEPHLFTL
jgi:hypothetical protein